MNNRHNPRHHKLGLICCVLLGCVLILSGVGKLFINLPNETEFLQNLAPVFSLSGWEAELIAYILPWFELLVGLLLVLQIWPQWVALFGCIPLTLCFITNNVWMIMSGVKYDTCNLCFGALEKYFGSLSPIQALIIDCILFILAICIISAGNGYKFMYGVLERGK